MPSVAPTLAPGIRKLQFTAMDVHEAGALLHLVFSHRSPSCPYGSRFLFPCNKMIQGTFALCAGNRSSLMKAATMSVVRGLSRNKVEGLCEVVWTIEANLAEGQLLYVTGDPVALGGWDPHMAVLMSATEDVNIWMARVKIAYGGNIKYNYFIKEGAQHSGDIIWRPGPQYSLSIPLNREKEQKVVVRDLWMKSKMDSWQLHTWSSWIDELAFTSRRDDDIKKYVNKDLKESNRCMEDCKAKDGMNYNEVSAFVDNNNSNSRSVFSERNQLIEEPWLQLTSLFSVGPRDMTKDAAAKENDNLRDEELEKINNQDNKLNRSILPEESASAISEDSFSTVILINSSICTMQRIAVLEDGNLVELLLEPVKTHVQCDSVYLGVVTKLVPHMGGAFVNIGGTRHSLMDIKSNREPFIFPPFCQKKQYVNDYVSAISKEHLAGVENGVISFKVAPLEEAAVDNSQESLAHDDYDESDDEEDCDVPEVHKSSMNGSMIGYGDAEVDSEDLADGERHLVDETAYTSAYFGRNGSSHSPASCSRSQDAKEIEGRVNDENRWDLVTKGTKIIVQVVKEGLGTKGPTLTAYPRLRSRFWILLTQCNRIGVSKKITGVERTRLKVIAKTLQPQGFGITVRTVAAGHSLEELQKDLTGLLSTWKTVVEHAKSAALAADEGIEGAVPVILHRAMGQTLSIVQDYFNEKAKRMVVDSPRTYHEVTNYLQEIAPDLCDRVELFEKQIPLFDEFKIEEEINRISSKRVPLPNGGSLVIEQTEALVSIDVNGGHVMFGHGTSQEKAILDVNLAASKQIARELRLRDIGGIIVVDFIDMADESDKRLVYEEIKKAVERDRSMVKVSELSRHGLMEITRKRVRPSVTFMISEPCSCCHATGRVEALETSFSKIEQEICRSLATMNRKSDPGNPKSWPRFVLRVDHHMCTYLTSGKKTRIAILSSSLKVWILLKVARGFSRGEFEVKPFTDEKAEKNKHQVAISMLRTAETGAHSSGSTKLKLVPVKKAKASKK